MYIWPSIEPGHALIVFRLKNKNIKNIFGINSGLILKLKSERKRCFGHDVVLSPSALVDRAAPAVKSQAGLEKRFCLLISDC